MLPSKNPNKIKAFLKRENTVVNNGSQLCKNLFTPALDKEPKLHHYNEIFII